MIKAVGMWSTVKCPVCKLLAGGGWCFLSSTSSQWLVHRTFTERPLSTYPQLVSGRKVAV